MEMHVYSPPPWLAPLQTHSNLLFSLDDPMLALFFIVGPPGFVTCEVAIVDIYLLHYQGCFLDHRIVHCVVIHSA